MFASFAAVCSKGGKLFDWWGHSGLYNVPEGGSGAAPDGWIVVGSHLVRKQSIMRYVENMLL